MQAVKIARKKSNRTAKKAANDMAFKLIFKKQLISNINF